jgi:hypothetical protein
MKFSDRILTRMEKSPKEFPRLKNWIAENPSRLPAMENRSWLPHYRSAREAKMVLFLGLFIPKWETWEIVARIRDTCYYQRYNGEWRQVQEILHKVTNLEEFNEVYGSFSSEDDFYGNFLRECEKFLRRNPASFKPVERDRRRARRKIRHRGYRDKGSLRPYHQRGRNLGELHSGEDLREKVSYGGLPDI